MREILDVSRGNMLVISLHVADVPQEQMCVRPAGAPGHPAWQLGHLAFVRASLLKTFGKPADVPSQWGEPFRRGSKPTDDATQYPSKDVLLSTLKTLNDQVLEAVAGLDEQTLNGVNPFEPLRKIAPTLRHMLAAVLTTHDGYHIGQLAAWRGAMKLPGVM